MLGVDGGGQRQKNKNKKVFLLSFPLKEFKNPPPDDFSANIFENFKISQGHSGLLVSFKSLNMQFVAIRKNRLLNLCILS